jgi:hypothetical protein
MEAMQEFIPVTVDKSHIITIGERLYTESIEFVRELVNNAYDADATLVEVIVEGDRIEVRDNGAGMDRDGLTQYFSIGSQEKLHASHSPVHRRDRIGQFGIGKFASLAACRAFEVLTRKEDFAARVVFDKQAWQRGDGTWRLPLEVLPLPGRQNEGTTILLTGLSREYRLEDIERRIREGTPLKAPHFQVILNGRLVVPRSLAGHMVPFLEGTPFGPVSGEIIVLPESGASHEDLGIEIKVKQVMIQRSLLGMETWGRTIARIRGEVYADFLPVTSDRTGFVEDSEEYHAFRKVMDRVIEDVRGILVKLGSRKDRTRTTKALREALRRVYQSLAQNPELSPFGALPIAGEGDGIGGAAEKASGLSTNRSPELDPGAPVPVPAPEKPKRKRRTKVRNLTPNAVVQRVRFGEAGVSCCVDAFGEDGPEAFTEGTIIYLNREHPLYQRESRHPDAHVLNLTRLLTQEISLMNSPRNPRQAFDRQSKLLRDALVDKEK